MTFNDLISQYGATVFDNQDRFADFITGAGWSIDIDAGTISFGPDKTLPIQVVGTEAEGDQSWLWAWANTQSELPDNLLHTVNTVRQFGETHGVGELTERSLSLADIGGNGHVPAMVAAGISGAAAYYRCPYDGGALYVLIPQLPASVKADDKTANHFISILMQFVGAVACDHRTALTSFAAYKGYKVDDQGAQVVCTSPYGEAITFDFDPQGRISDVKGTLTAAPSAPLSPAPAFPAAKKPWWKLGR